MKLATEIYEINGSFHVEVGVTDVNPFTPAEAEALKNFGEPAVNCGGAVTADEVTITLPPNFRRFPSQFPVKAIFAVADNVHAADLATAFRVMIETLLTNARNTLIAGSSAGVGTWVTSV
jgi:hypothetical protein